MTLINILSLLGGVGIGAMIQTLFTIIARNKEMMNKRCYIEKRNAYLGLLTALHDAAVHPSMESSKAYALWQTKVDLFGSVDVRKFAQEMVDTNDTPKERSIAFNNLKNSMRRDLNIDKGKL